MNDQAETCLAEFYPTEAADLLQPGGSVLFLSGKLYREAQVKHPACARFSIKNDQGLFFVKVYESSLVEQVIRINPGAELAILGEMHSFVSRRCQNHHVFVKAIALFPHDLLPRMDD